MTDKSIPLDTRLLNAMKRLRLENIQLQRQLRGLQSDFGQASAQATDHAFRSRELEMELHSAQRQLQGLPELQRRLLALETAKHQWEAQRAAVTQLAQRQGLDLQELRTLLRQKERELEEIKQASQSEMEEVKTKARQVIVQHYQSMKSAQEQAQAAFEEARRAKSQLEAIRAPMSSGRRKVLPPRGVRTGSLAAGSN